MSERAKRIEEAARRFLADVEELFPVTASGRGWHPDSMDALRAALSTPAPEGGDRCPTCLQMPDAYQKGIEDGARGQYRRGVEDAARVIIGLRTLARDASDLDVLEMAANRVGALALAPPATEGATKEET